MVLITRQIRQQRSATIKRVSPYQLTPRIITTAGEDFHVCRLINVREGSLRALTTVGGYIMSI